MKTIVFLRQKAYPRLYNHALALKNDVGQCEFVRTSLRRLRDKVGTTRVSPGFLSV